MKAPESFGERLAQERREKAAAERRDWLQKDVAAAIGITPTSYSRWEAGLVMPDDTMILRLAQFFGVTPAWLRYGQEPRQIGVRSPELAPTKSGAPLAPLVPPPGYEEAKPEKSKRRKGA